jgi:UDP-2-acetamido-3-amino-2,3-dideoxy-glucuronate N-acetyltransferase
MVHPTSVVLGHVEIDPTSYVGPFCLIGAQDGPVDTIAPVLTTVIGFGTELLSHVVIGMGSRLESNVWCDHHTLVGMQTVVGSNTQIMYGARIYHRVVIGTNVWIGGFVCNDARVEDGAIVFGQLVHRFVKAQGGVAEAAPIVRRGAFVGMNAQIIGPVEIGEDAYIAAGTVLAKDARPRRLYMGNPARDVGDAPSPFEER